MTLNHLRFPIVCLVLLTAFSSCFSNKANLDNNTSLLANCWTHSYEDNTDERETYLPCDAKDFQPSRYRAQFTLAENGTCTFSVLAANDAHTSDTGTWTYDSETKTLIMKGSNGVVAHSYVIEVLEPVRILLK
ncbi:MAG: hypothetical protein ACI9VN_003397 [Patescibacteria group bacterium]|jgi:hypothetical protein